MLTSVLISVALSATTIGVPPRALASERCPLAAAVARAFSGTAAGPVQSPVSVGTSSSRDPLKNGAIIGALVGAATVGLLATIGCGLGHVAGLTPTDESHCGGAAFAGAALGGGLGALLGVGLDALFERTPYLGSGATRRGVQLRVRF